MASWIAPKSAHKDLVRTLLQVKAHVILNLRAEDKIEMVVGANGKKEVRAKETLTSILGWIPICERRLPFELTASFLVTPDAPGVPKVIKLQEQHRPFFPLDQPISEEGGKGLGEWAAGGRAVGADPAVAHSSGDTFASEPQRRLIFAKAKENGVDQAALKQIVLSITGQESSAAIPAGAVDAVLLAVEAQGVAA